MPVHPCHTQGERGLRALSRPAHAAAFHADAHDGFDPAYGARPLKRLIQQEIENPLAKRILQGEFSAGDHISVDTRGEAFTFEKR